tara:strand:- start:1991 stop:3001 length:1011 start_codon:yes stop_codon:yes gene_type:complete
MCSDLRESYDLDIRGKAKANIEALTADCYKIGISGQGEPLLNQKAILDVLSLPGANRRFDIMTSGNIPTSEFSDFMLRINDVAAHNNDHCNVYLSIDEYHIDRLQHENLANAIDLCLQEDLRFVDVAIRSITTNKQFVREYVEDTLGSNHSLCWSKETPLRHVVAIDNYKVGVHFRNIVGSPERAANDLYSVEKYISLLERNAGRPFKFGSLATSDRVGLNITIDPNGDVFFYGLEFEPLGNIYRDTLDQSTIKTSLVENELYSILLQVPFLDVLAVLREDPQMSDLIDKVNSPYWIIRSLHAANPKKLREGILAADLKFHAASDGSSNTTHSVNA